VFWHPAPSFRTFSEQFQSSLNTQNLTATYRLLHRRKAKSRESRLPLNPTTILVPDHFQKERRKENALNKGTTNTHRRSLGQHAIVLGGSLAGLLAARVLSDHFEQVTLIERDAFPSEPEARRGTPQANHVHALMPRGRQIVEQLFPELHNSMMSDGALLVDMAKDVAWLTPQGWGVNFDSDLNVLAFTRPLLDLNVRRLLFSNPRVRVLQNTEIMRLVAGDGDRVSGVLIKRNTDNGEGFFTELSADLVIDATGRASLAPEWLKDINFPTPKETVINAHLGYASRLYRIPKNFEADWTCVFMQAAPPERKRGAILFTVEGNRWLVTMIGGGRDYPPKDELGFLEFARSLPDPVIYNAIQQAEPISPIKVHRGTENRLRHYDKLKRLPENFVALGDSVCAFNPVYGQGMTIAAMGALALDECLREQKNGLRGFSKLFQKRLTNVTAAPWMLATSEDYRYRETEGGSPNLSTRFMHSYMDKVLKLATFDSEVREVLLQAFGMLVLPTALFRPKILKRVLRYKFFGAPIKTEKARSRIRTTFNPLARGTHLETEN
jgi:2-polyprenyl-6-methoxyphenol hydroxylase-like FAD-dependent oxidoreductase